MRAILAFVMMTAPAMAQDAPEAPGYDPTLLSACLAQAGDGDGGREACIGTASDACMAAPGGATTLGMNDCLMAETREWDGLLNQWYGDAMARAKQADADMDATDPSLEKRAPVLQQAQRDWIGFRDASCKFQALRYQGGSMAGTVHAACMMDLTADQALRLRPLAEDEG